MTGRHKEEEEEEFSERATEIIKPGLDSPQLTASSVFFQNKMMTTMWTKMINISGLGDNVP